MVLRTFIVQLKSCYTNTWIVKIMSKIKVNELEAKTDNTNIKLTPLGTGAVTVKGAGGNDGTLELKTLQGNNGVKLKSPPHSAGQSYTLTLPDTNIEADKFLRVKSKTGSGNTATGQLECATLAATDLTQLNASNLTSGTLPSSVLPTALPATAGAGLALVSHTSIVNNTSTNITSLDFTFDDDTQYLLIFKKFRWSSYFGNMYIYCADSNGNFYQDNGGQNLAYSYMREYHTWVNNSGNSNFNLDCGAGSHKYFSGVFDISTRASTGWASFLAMQPGNQENGVYGYFSTVSSYSDINGPRMYGLRFVADVSSMVGGGSYITDADVLLYKFLES